MVCDYPVIEGDGLPFDEICVHPKLVRAEIENILPRMRSRAEIVDGFCKILRASDGCSECEFCNGGECSDPRAHAASELYISAMKKVLNTA